MWRGKCRKERERGEGGGEGGHLLAITVFTSYNVVSKYMQCAMLLL